MYAHNTRATDAYLPSLDAAVLVTSADPPIAGAERGFLERVLDHAVRLFVVLNKTDYLAAGDLERRAAALPAEELATRRAQFTSVVNRLAGDAADDAALLGAAVRRGLHALDELIGPHRMELARRAEQATLQAAECHPDAGPGRLL